MNAKSLPGGTVLSKYVFIFKIIRILLFSVMLGKWRKDLSRRLGIYKFMPLFFILGAAIELFMIKVRVGNETFCKSVLMCMAQLNYILPHAKDRDRESTSQIVDPTSGILDLLLHIRDPESQIVHYSKCSGFRILL